MRNIDSAVENFAPYFRASKVGKGTCGDMLNTAFELRYEVYCLDCGYLPASDYPEQRESDRHDDDAEHFFARNLKQELVGYVRLVGSDTQGRFPWQDHCTNLYEGVELPAPATVAEISRLMVRRDYRRRRGDTLSGVATTSSTDVVKCGERRSESPQILLSLYRQMYLHSLEAGLTHWYAAMERPLARVLHRMGFTFQQLGDETDYFGPVAPYLADLRQLETNLARQNPGLLAWFQKPQGPDN